MAKKETEKLYSEEISLLTQPEYEDYVLVNLRKIREIRRNFDIPFIGIAGTEGKTTTKRMLSAILGSRGPVLETPLDCSTASGVTSTLLKLNNTYKYALLELGIVNQEQFKLAASVSEPTIGVVTNIGEAHMANLGDKFLIADAKVELIRKLPSDGYAVLNIDDELVSAMDAYSPTPHVIKFGFNGIAHFFASDIKYLGPNGMEFVVNNFYKFHLPIYGSTSVYNALAAISVARILNFEFDEIQHSLFHNFSQLQGRGDFIDLSDIYILNHSYNATINAVNKACESLVQFRKYSKQLILVLGNIDDLGKESEKVHLNLGYYISALPIDVVITVGEDARLVGEGIRKINHNKKILYHCENPMELPDRVFEYLEPHTTLLSIGGKSLNLQSSLFALVERIKKTSSQAAS